MSSDSVQHIVSDITQSNADKGTSGALAAFQKEYTQYAASHSAADTSSTMQQVQDKLFATAPDCAMAMAADWVTKFHVPWVAEKKAVSKDDLRLIDAAGPNETATDNKQFATPFDKVMSHLMQTSYERMRSAHTPMIGSDSPNVEKNDLDALLAVNEQHRAIFAAAKNLVAPNGDGKTLFAKLANIHGDSTTDYSYFTDFDISRLLQTNDAVFRANGTKVLTDAEVKTLKDIQANPQVYASWRDANHHGGYTTDKIAQAAGYQNAAALQEMIKAHQ